MTYQPRLQRYECDYENCRLLIPKSQPVVFHNGKHFCSTDCYHNYLDDCDERKRIEEERAYVADLGQD